MALNAFHSCFFLINYLIGSAIFTCEGPYLNLCGYNENELNTTEIDDSAETICDCDKVSFCYLTELSQECNSTIVKLSTGGYSTLSDLQCDILPLKSTMKTPTYEFLNQTENNIVMKILIDSNFGRYKISCSVHEIFEEFNTTTNKEWEILSVDPFEVTIDSQIELQLTVKQTANSPVVWCFVKTPDNNTEVFSTFWKTDTQINCGGFKPVIPGIFQVSLHSEMNSNIFDKSLNVRVLSKSPTPVRAEYSSDFERILIYFDENIELFSSCINVFSKEDSNSFGKKFDCFIRGNALIVKMGKEFQIVNKVSISSENKICRAGSSAEFCLSASSACLVLSTPKILDPSLSLYVNPTCGTSSEKYIRFKLTPFKNSNFIKQNQTFLQGSSGKIQRRNLIMWKTMRKIQNKFSSPLIIPHSNTAEVLSLFEKLSILDDLDFGEKNLGSASVSVFVQSSSSSSSILAEASVTFCEGSTFYHYRWVVNKKNVFKDGKVLILEDMAPGKYVIKCLVVNYNSSDILGQGWATTEILPNTQKVIITPSEITLGTTDNISLQAITWRRTTISWTCKTILGKLCTTTDQKLASEVFDLTSLSISIPAGIFPVGDYVWSVENAEPVNTAKIFIKPGSRTTVGVEGSTFVQSSEEFVLRGIFKKLQHDCRAWWSSVREKGFSYLKLDNMREKKEKLKGQHFSANEIDLVVPISSENQKGVDSNILYMFKLQVFCPSGTNNQNGTFDYIKVPISVNNPPRVSPIIVEPLEGFAMITGFMVSGGEADVSDFLVFEWSYVDSCDEEVSIKRGAFGRNFTTYLPPGDIKLNLKVCNEKGICSVTSTSVINVIQESEFPAEIFQNARNEIEFLISSGDTLEAFGLAITAIKSLALIYEPEFRNMIFSTVGEGIKARIKELTKRMESDSKAAKLCLEFFEQAAAVAKYFRKDSDILIQLTEFKNKILRVMNSKKVNRSF